jgi:hypothetical protein
MDEIVINLKLLARVGKHQKLVTRDAFLNVEAKSLVPECVRRWRRGDDRNSAITKINDIVVSAIEQTDTVPSLKKELEDAMVGIENMKETYAPCCQTCARLDTILDKIRLCVEKKNNSL